jgi:hypothetical protein
VVHVQERSIAGFEAPWRLAVPTSPAVTLTAFDEILVVHCARGLREPPTSCLINNLLGGLDPGTPPSCHELPKLHPSVHPSCSVGPIPEHRPRGHHEVQAAAGLATVDCAWHTWRLDHIHLMSGGSFAKTTRICPKRASLWWFVGFINIMRRKMWKATTRFLMKWA